MEPDLDSVRQRSTVFFDEQSKNSIKVPSPLTWLDFCKDLLNLDASPENLWKMWTVEFALACKQLPDSELRESWKKSRISLDTKFRKKVKSLRNNNDSLSKWRSLPNLNSHIFNAFFDYVEKITTEKLSNFDSSDPELDLEDLEALCALYGIFLVRYTHPPSFFEVANEANQRDWHGFCAGVQPSPIPIDLEIFLKEILEGVAYYTLSHNDAEKDLPQIQSFGERSSIFRSALIKWIFEYRDQLLAHSGEAMNKNCWSNLEESDWWDSYVRELFEIFFASTPFVLKGSSKSSTSRNMYRHEFAKRSIKSHLKADNTVKLRFSGKRIFEGIMNEVKPPHMKENEAKVLEDFFSLFQSALYSLFHVQHEYEIYSEIPVHLFHCFGGKLLWYVFRAHDSDLFTMKLMEEFQLPQSVREMLSLNRLVQLIYNCWLRSCETKERLESNTGEPDRQAPKLSVPPPSPKKKRTKIYHIVNDDQENEIPESTSTIEASS
ncbi:hypothetical protein HK098_002027 [Nowakowskiella sp. JEL0407]|nr:hypothetical protein HK098_002027 [Nowakowskiella sp. JEL0407]